ncbi:VOC family protein [Autumnicola psychrophila]|uniref:VOC family protein n=1 Tax=Autumnicola psychrophila TaxID=3075592 RepID=A0ABU3DU90_9FLAO|nr:VOC family protein [Zunongwangia sp. F225]MDT0687272.1 VOC family protein [Zunongwangia sp. F225]
MKIEKLQIFTSNLEAQIAFYRNVMELEIQNEDKNSFELTLGYTVLRFEKKEGATPYHIAFHIPDNEEKEALKWLKKKVAIQKSGDDEIVDFSNWNAKSIYFYDADKNILEFISRRNLNPKQLAYFSAESIAGIAEIGLATTNIEEKFFFLHRECCLEIFDGNLEKFCAVGDPEGLIITIKKNLKDWFPVDDKAFSSEFALDFTHENQKCKIVYQDEQLKIL